MLTLSFGAMIFFGKPDLDGIDIYNTLFLLQKNFLGGREGCGVIKSQDIHIIVFYRCFVNPT